MSYIVSYWKPDGSNGESEINHVYIKRVSEASALSEFPNRPFGCVRVTLDRTDKQSFNSRTLWIKPGYIDPFLLPRSQPQY